MSEEVKPLEEVAKLPQFTEFETKYRTELEMVIPFKDVVRALPGLKRFVYTEGPDVYYTNANNKFIRYRRADFPSEPKFAQWTVKTKPEGAKNSIKREEPNVILGDTAPEEVEKCITAMGYQLNFKIWKACHIYDYDDATLVFYSVRDEGNGKWDHFIEIEVDEKTIHHRTEEEAWAVIEKYEKILAPAGVSPQKRLKKNLFEMYFKEKT